MQSCTSLPTREELSGGLSNISSNMISDTFSGYTNACVPFSHGPDMRLPGENLDPDLLGLEGLDVFSVHASSFMAP